MKRLWLGLLLLTIGACALHWHGDETTSLPSPADLVIRNARLVDPVKGTVGSAIASRQGKIVALGTDADVKPYISLLTRLMDAGGGTLTPGLVDAHGHLLGLGMDLDKADLRGTRSEDEMVSRVEEFAKKRPEGWILGRGWDQNPWTPAEFPTHVKLSARVPDRPVLLTRVDGHAVLANAAAMAAAKVDKNTPDPPGGRIVRDAAGELTGIFVDTASGLVERAVPAVNDADRERAYLAAQATCLSMGLTGVHDAGLSYADQAALRKLDETGKLRLRVYGMASADSLPVKPTRGERFELRAVKAYADGALGSRGAALLEPYSDEPNNRGLLITTEADLTALGDVCFERGFQLCTHAIGDLGNKTVLDAYAAVRKKHAEKTVDLRWRVEHCQVVEPGDFARFRELGVIASMQPTHATSDGPWAPARVGEKRMEGAYAWRRFLDSKVPLTFGSDFPVESADPRFGLFAAVTRRPPDAPERPPFGPGAPLTQLEALHAFTAGAAYASFHEKERGRLEIGRRADYTVFDRDVFPADRPETILTAHCIWTVIDGVVVYPQ